MIESIFNPNADSDGFLEIDDKTVREWNSLNNLLSELAHQSSNGSSAHNFAIPALLGDGDGISRWVVVLRNVRNLSHVARLRRDLPRMPWCIASRVIEIGPEAIRVGVTSTAQIGRDKILSSIRQIVTEEGSHSISVHPVVREKTGENWITANEAAQQLGVKPRTVTHWIELGLVVAKQAETSTGQQWLIRTGQPFTNHLIGV